MKLIFKFIFFFFLLFIFVATGTGFYFFVLPPQVIGITPENNSENILLNTEVENGRRADDCGEFVVFNRLFFALN